MNNRDAIGSWLSGPRAAAEDMGADFGHRGERLGLPAEGPRSIAPVGRRLGALFIDWALGVFTVMSLLTVGTIGCTPGKRLLGLRVVSVEGLGRLALWRTAVRTVLLALAVPALIWDRDGRGLHDRISGAVQVRT